MQIGMITDSLGSRPLDEVLDITAELGLDTVEIATGNWSEAPHADLDELVSSKAARDELANKITSRSAGVAAAVAASAARSSVVSGAATGTRIASGLPARTSSARRWRRCRRRLASGSSASAPL